MTWTRPQIVQGLVGAFIVGALGFLAIWSQTDDVKVLTTAGLVPAFTHLGIALGIRGVESRK